MKELLLRLLETFDVPVMQQGTLAPAEEYPPDFITFDITDSPTIASFDDLDAMTAWEIEVNYYSNNPVKVAEIPQDIRETLKNNGFIADGRGHMVMSDEQTHTGWGITFYFLEESEGF